MLVGKRFGSNVEVNAETEDSFAAKDQFKNVSLLKENTFEFYKGFCFFSADLLNVARHHCKTAYF